MKIHTQKCAVASAISMGILFTVCAGLSHLWPSHALQLSASLFHMTSLELLAPYFQVTVVNFFSGLVQWMFYTYLFVGLFGWIYNRLIG